MGIISGLEYSIEVCGTYTEKLVLKLEEIHKLALRFIFSKYGRWLSLTEPYFKAGVNLPEERRSKKRSKLLYMILSTTDLIKKVRLIRLHSSIITRNKHTRTLEVYRCAKYCLKCIFPQTIRECNALPEVTGAANTVYTSIGFEKVIPWLWNCRSLYFMSYRVLILCLINV